jgi:tetrahydromethanopterin S-methyltransferase subunit G
MTMERTTSEWRQWVHDHRDMHLRTVVLDCKDFLSILKRLDDAESQVTRIRRAWDEERQRL